LKRQVFYIIALLALFQVACQSIGRQSPEELYTTHCGSCHLLPDPGNIPHDIWDDHVLPNMAARLGVTYKGFDFKEGNSMLENAHIKMSNTYPPYPLIDSLAFLDIRDYILDHAPERILVDSSRVERHKPMEQFRSKSFSLRDNYRSGITNIQFDKTSNSFLIGDAKGSLYEMTEDKITLINSYRSPVISRIAYEERIYQTEIGNMHPSEIPRGAIYTLDDDESLGLVAKDLHRPVYVKMADINNNGREEIIICEYGNLTGELSLLVQDYAGKYQKRSLLAVAGTIKLDVVDMNGDGLQDIVVLAAQGDEAIYIGYQEDDLVFDMQKVIRHGSEYGSSWYELIDYDKDGDLDIIMANGDNIDYSIFLKPYHGLRLYINDGDNGFQQEWFYPMYGATRVIAEDFDQDGDIDFAATSYFPDHDNSPTEGFLYLENQDADIYDFKSFAFANAILGNWLIMERGDIDQDGDLDIILGSLILPQGTDNKEVAKIWDSTNVDLMLLENSLK